MQSKISSHASQRIFERSLLSEEQIREIIDSDRAILVAQEDHGRKIHKLFWSTIDLSWYVAVQDVNNGGVITLLPPNASYFAMDDNALGQARLLALEYEKLMLNNSSLKLILDKLVTPAYNQTTISLHLAAYLQVDSQASREVIIGLLAYDDYTQALVASIITDIRLLINQEIIKIKNLNEVCTGFRLKLNSKGQWHRFI